MRASRRADARVARDLRDRLEVDAALSGLSNMSAFADIGRPLNALVPSVVPLCFNAGRQMNE